jgi:hypothetical protein
MAVGQEEKRRKTKFCLIVPEKNKKQYSNELGPIGAN